MYINTCEVCKKQFFSLTQRKTCDTICLSLLKRKSIKQTYEQKGSSEQICFNCQRATGKCIDNIVCPWARALKPVPGWEARKITLRDGDNYSAYESYDIISCPLFLKDAPKEPAPEAFIHWKELRRILQRYRSQR